MTDAEKLIALADKYRASEIRWMNIVTKLKQDHEAKVAELEARLSQKEGA